MRAKKIKIPTNHFPIIRRIFWTFSSVVFNINYGLILRSRTPEIGTSGSMSGDGKRGDGHRPQLPRPSSTLPEETVDGTWQVVGLLLIAVEDGELTRDLLYHPPIERKLSR